MPKASLSRLLQCVKMLSGLFTVSFNIFWMPPRRNSVGFLLFAFSKHGFSSGRPDYLELSLKTRLVSNSQTSVCLCLLSAWIKGMCYHCLALCIWKTDILFLVCVCVVCVCMCVCLGVRRGECATVSRWRLEDSFQESLLSFQHIGPEHWTQVVRLNLLVGSCVSFILRSVQEFILWKINI